MYEPYYGLREKPFSLVPDPAFLFFSDKHQSALAMLEYGLLNRSGFTVISGGIGTGKTTLVRHLLNHMEQDITLGLITNTHQNFDDLLQWILMAFGLPFSNQSQAEMHQAFVDFVIHEYARNRRTVLIVDESQNLSPQALEELRMLSNINADKDVVLQIVLVGQKELLDTLKRPDLTQFAQRITANYHLEPLTSGETRAYIRHRLVVAGGSPKVFSDAACDEVFKATGGVPRLINLLADAAMVYGFAEQRPQIDAALIRDVAQDKRKGGLFPQQEEVARRHEADASWLKVFGPEAPRERPRHRPAWQVHDHYHLDPGDGVLHVAIASDSAIRRSHLEELLRGRDAEITANLSLNDARLGQLDPGTTHVLLVDLDDADDDHMANVRALRSRVGVPILFNESRATEASLAGIDPGYADRLYSKLAALAPQLTEGAAPAGADDGADARSETRRNRSLGHALAERLVTQDRGQPRPDNPARPASAAEDPDRPLRLAIVSDNPGIAIALGDILRAEGLEIDLGHSLDDELTAHLDPQEISALVLDYSERNSAQGSRILASLTLWGIPILVNTRSAAEAYLAGEDDDFPQRLLRQLADLIPGLGRPRVSPPTPAPDPELGLITPGGDRRERAQRQAQVRITEQRVPAGQLARRLTAGLLALLWMALIYVLSDQPQPPMTLAIPGGDWIMHALGYGILGLLLLWTLRPEPYGYTLFQALIATLLATLYGISDEWHQGFVDGRTPDVLDLLFDALGALIFSSLAALWSRREPPRNRHY